MSDTASDQGAQRWHAPAIDGSDGRGFLTAGRLQEMQREAHDEAYKEGHAAGLAAGSEEIQRRVKRLESVLTALAKPLDELDEMIEKELVDLAITIARQLFRREIHVDRGSVVGVVRETVPLLPLAAREIKVHLHPEDAELVRASMMDSGDEVAWKIVEDPLISRGGCSVHSESSHIDARAETRFQAIVNAITGDERAS